jgi:hypothetical protein
MSDNIRAEVEVEGGVMEVYCSDKKGDGKLWGKREKTEI